MPFFRLADTFKPGLPKVIDLINKNERLFLYPHLLLLSRKKARPGTFFTILTKTATARHSYLVPIHGWAPGIIHYTIFDPDRKGSGKPRGEVCASGYVAGCIDSKPGEIFTAFIREIRVKAPM